MTTLVEKIQSSCNAYRVVKFVLLLNIVFIPVFKVKIRAKKHENLSILYQFTCTIYKYVILPLINVSFSIQLKSFCHVRFIRIFQITKIIFKVPNIYRSFLLSRYFSNLLIILLSSPSFLATKTISSACINDHPNIYINLFVLQYTK